MVTKGCVVFKAHPLPYKVHYNRGSVRRWYLYLASPYQTTIELRMYHALPMNTSSILSLGV